MIDFGKKESSEEKIPLYLIYKFTLIKTKFELSYIYFIIFFWPVIPPLTGLFGGVSQWNLSHPECHTRNQLNFEQFFNENLCRTIAWYGSSKVFFLSLSLRPQSTFCVLVVVVTEL